MNRKRFVEISTGLAGAFASIPIQGLFEINSRSIKSAGSSDNANELSADLVICGGGLGGCAAAMAALRNNLKIILTEETDWIGDNSHNKVCLLMNIHGSRLTEVQNYIAIFEIP